MYGRMDGKIDRVVSEDILKKRGGRKGVRARGIRFTFHIPENPTLGCCHRHSRTTRSALG